MITQSTKGLTTIEEVLTHITIDTFYKGYAHSFIRSNHEYKKEELFSCFIEAVLNMKPERVLQLCKSGEFKYYSAAIIRNLVFKKSSNFNKYNNDDIQEFDASRYDKEEEQRSHYNQQQSEELLSDIDTFLTSKAGESNELWYDSNVFKLYHSKYKSYRKMAAATGIPVSSLYYSVQKSKVRLRKNFKTQYNNILKDGTD
jgi:hypothetical protein